jgi:8-oxo-dGTP diphosphatase
MPKRDHLEVIARAVLRHGGSVLACRSVEGDYFYLPGGHVEHGERAAAAAARELIEEAGLGVTPGECVLVSEGIFEARGRRHHEINLVFLVEPVEGFPPDQPAPAIQSREPEIAFEWLDLASVGDVDFRPESIRAWLASGGEFDTSAARCGWIGANP